MGLLREQPAAVAARALVAGCLVAALGALAAPGVAGARTLHVKAGAAPGGDGSRAEPLRSLRAIERRSHPRDRIVVLASGPRRGTLGGGILLKRGQRLIGSGRSIARHPNARRAARITNESAARLDGDAVRLAGRTTVRNLAIGSSHRGAIYGRNKGRVRIRGNLVTGHNVSCAEGFHIPPFLVPTTAPGVGIPISEGLANGWAAIMLDADRGHRRFRVSGNRVRRSECGDGIDVRLSGTARASALIKRNRISKLRQGPELESVLAFGLQAIGESHLTAALDRNRQTNLGNAEDPGVYVLGADTEGVFGNMDGAGRLDLRITRNTYTNPDGLGGFSANGVEIVNMGDDGARSQVTIADSSFTGTPGDVIEQLNFGAGGRMEMTLRRVVAARSVGQGNTIVIPGNNGDCLLSGNGAAAGSLEMTVIASELTDCSNNGITVGSNVVEGTGAARRMSLDLRGSTVTGNRGSNLLAGAFNDIGELEVRVEDSDLSDSQGGPGISLANVAFESLGQTASGLIDMGGGALGSPGNNCLAGGVLAANVIGIDVAAERNWWGTPGGPGLGRTLAAGGTLDSAPALDAPPACGLF